MSKLKNLILKTITSLNTDEDEEDASEPQFQAVRSGARAPGVRTSRRSARRQHVAHADNGDEDVLDEAIGLDIEFTNAMLPERAMELLINHAVNVNASDLFISCYEEEVEVSVRHLGIIKKIALLPLELGFLCINYVRAVSGLKHHEKRRPQDGRWIYRRPDGELTVDLRLNTMPTLYGESIAMRLLVRDSQLQSLDNIGMVGSQLGTLLSLLHSPSGLILVTGPTGSGKTTTLYACLHYLNDGRRKIHTIEDPIEYAVHGLCQTQANQEHGAGFAELLRGVVRQGPDVIMIGEIRDRPTAEVAVRAANSGQLVFATLHATVAAAAVQSMLGLEIPAHFLASSLLAVISQRLVRTLNPDTRVPVDLSAAPHTFSEVENWLEPGQGKVVYAASEDREGNEGYLGRTGVFEMMTMSPPIRKQINEMAPAAVLHEFAVQEGMIDFQRAALLKVAQGLTSFDEMQRALPSTDEWAWASVAHSQSVSSNGPARVPLGA